MKLPTRLPDGTRVGPVVLTVASLDRQIAFHVEQLGLVLLDRSGSEATLGTGEEPLLHLVEERAARRYPRTTGLYHTAILLPTALAFGYLVRHLAEAKTLLQGASDHGTHLALYLADAEGNGLELAWDRPRREWPMANGQLRFVSKAPNLRPVLELAMADGQAWEGMPSGTRVGHVHLTMSDLHAARRFYHELLGFDITADMGRQGALFVSAGGYHHHIGMNVWQGEGIPPAPEGALGLRQFTLLLPTRGDVEALRQRLDEAGVPCVERDGGLFLRDPAHNGLLIAADRR